MLKTFNEQDAETLAEIFINRGLRKHRWLVELAQKRQIQLILLQDIIEFLDKVMNLKKEGEQVNIGLVLKNKQLKINPPLLARRKFHISKVSKFLHLKNIVNGSSLSYIVDENGMVTIGQIPSNLSEKNPRLVLQNISKIYKTITFYLRGLTAEIYDSGKSLRIYRHGVCMKPCIIQLKKLGAEGFPLPLLKLILESCVKLSEINKGSTFVITKNDDLEYCYPMVRGCKFKKCRVDGIPKDQLLSFAGLDGAIILNIKSEILNIGQRLESPPSTNYKESGRGTRHNAAANYSGAVDSVVFVVSKDGPISLYFKGHLFARCFGELFGTK